MSTQTTSGKRLAIIIAVVFGVFVVVAAGIADRFWTINDLVPN